MYSSINADVVNQVRRPQTEVKRIQYVKYNINKPNKTEFVP